MHRPVQLGRKFDISQQQAGAVIVLLGIGNEARALAFLEQLPTIRSPAMGSPTSLQVLVKNAYHDPVLDKPEFVAARSGFGLALQ